MVDVAVPNFQSLLITPMVNGLDLASATGFIVRHGNDFFIVTNWHVLSGRHVDTEEPMHDSAATPDAVRITHTTGDLNTRIDLVEPLKGPGEDGPPLWLELPSINGHRVDVGAVRLTNLQGAQPIAHDINAGGSIYVPITGRLSVIGFPFGIKAASGLPIWTQGFVATEIALPFDGRPCFLIDARTREGQSGSPVLFYSESGLTASGPGGLVLGGSQPAMRFTGIYSGRVNKQSDLGRVWNPATVSLVVGGGQPAKPL
jgi:hypothetical protein